QVVEHVLHVARDVGDRAAGPSRRLPVPGTAVGDQFAAPGVRRALERTERTPGSGGPVVEQQGNAVHRAGGPHRQAAAVPGRHQRLCVPRHGAPPVRCHGGCPGHPHRSTGPPVPGFTRRSTGPPGSVVPRSPAVAPGVLLRRHELTDAAWDFVPRCPPVTTGPPPWRLPAARAPAPPVPAVPRRATGPPGSVVPRSPAVAPGVLLRRHELTDAAWDFVPRCPPVTTGPPPWRLPAARVPARRRPA